VCGICGEESDTGAGFPVNISASLAYQPDGLIYIYTHTHIKLLSSLGVGAIYWIEGSLRLLLSLILFVLFQIEKGK
jgi:hypothetical protein